MDIRAVVGAARVKTERKVGETVASVSRRLSGSSDAPPPKTLFVMAHARSGSTLVTHLLGAHDDILSVGEHHVSYHKESDLRRLRDRSAFMASDLKARPLYVVDKIVYNEHTISDDLLGDPSVRFLFLLRRPEGTLPSVGKMFGQADISRQLAYYRRRLDEMVTIAKKVGDPTRSAFMTYEQITGQPNETLSYLSDFLDLDSPLNKDYDVSRTTGRQAWGDPSERIFSGTIDLRRSESDPLPVDIAVEADAVHAFALFELSKQSAANPLVGGS